MNNSQILNSIQDNNVPIILVLTNNSNPDDLVKDIINKLSGQSVSNLNNNIVDLITYDGHIQSIKKDNILHIIKQFSHASIGDKNIKFYYLKNCEQSSNETFNCLLKFLEEPQDRTIGILTTNSINALPITIRSRCNIFYLEPDIQALQTLQQKINLPLNHWIFSLFNNINELEVFCLSDNFLKLISMHDFFVNHDLNIYKAKFDEFKNWDFNFINLLINSLILVTDLEQQKQLLMILENMEINPVRPLIFLKIFKITGGFHV